MDWRHTSSPTKVKPKQMLTSRKVMFTVFWDRQGALLIDFLPRDKTINRNVFVRHLRNCSSLHIMCRGMLAKGVVFIPTPFDMPSHTLRMWQKNSYRALDVTFLTMLCTAPTMLQATFICFCTLSLFLAVSASMKSWKNMIEKAGSKFYDEGMQNIVPRYGKYLENHRSCQKIV